MLKYLYINIFPRYIALISIWIDISMSNNAYCTYIYIYNMQKRAEEEHLDKIYISMFKYIKLQTN
jgi:hypothetical protein